MFHPGGPRKSTQGLSGAVVAALGTFAPVYAVTLLAAPWFHRIARDSGVRVFVAGITAAATGAILGAAFLLCSRALPTTTSWMIFVAVAAALLACKGRIPEPLIILVAGVAGVVLD